MPPLKKYLTQWKERMFIILWILRTKLIPIKLQLDNLLQAKQLRFCFETMKCFSQSVSQWSTNQLQFCSERMKFFSQSVSQWATNQTLASWSVSQSVYEKLKPHSHRSLNMFKSCLVKHGLNFLSLIKAANYLKLIVNLIQITKHVEFHLNPVWNPVFQFSMSVFHFFKPGLIKHV